MRCEPAGRLRLCEAAGRGACVRDCLLECARSLEQQQDAISAGLSDNVCALIDKLHQKLSSTRKFRLCS